jgi:hypothetical protein
MASKEQIQQALSSLHERYGNTLMMLSDAVDKIDDQASRISELESQLSVEPEFDIDLSVPAEISALEEKIKNRQDESN